MRAAKTNNVYHIAIKTRFKFILNADVNRTRAYGVGLLACYLNSRFRYIGIHFPSVGL